MSETNTITIAKALREIKKLKGRISDLDARIVDAVSWRKDRQGEFDFNKLIDERAEFVTQLIGLKAARDRANAVNELTFKDARISIAQAIAQMSELKGEVKLITVLQIRRGSEEEHRSFDRSGEPTFRTIVWESALTEQAKLQQLDDLREQIDELNDRLEEANHSVRIEL